MSYYGFGYFAFVFGSDAILRDERNFQRLFAKIKESGWRFLAPKDRPRPLEKKFLDDSLVSINSAWQKSVTTEQYGASIDFCDNHNFVAGLGLDFDHQYLKLLVTTNYSNFHELEPLANERMRSLINLCEIVYTTLEPVYGYGLTSQENATLDEYLDTTPTIHAIHNCNFLGAEIVNFYGRKNLLSIPTWRTIEFPDGGILLEMRPYPPAPEYKTFKLNYEYITQILGINDFRLGV